MSIRQRVRMIRGQNDGSTVTPRKAEHRAAPWDDRLVPQAALTAALLDWHLKVAAGHAVLRARVTTDLLLSITVQGVEDWTDLDERALLAALFESGSPLSEFVLQEWERVVATCRAARLAA
jgi:hypothetical protein